MLTRAPRSQRMTAATTGEAGMAGGGLVAVQSVKLCSDDGTSNLTSEAWAAFVSGGIVEAEPDVFEAAGDMELFRAPGDDKPPAFPRAADLDPPGELLSPQHVLAML